jgi:ferredoxin
MPGLFRLLLLKVTAAVADARFVQAEIQLGTCIECLAQIAATTAWSVLSQCDRHTVPNSARCTGVVVQAAWRVQPWCAASDTMLRGIRPPQGARLSCLCSWGREHVCQAVSRPGMFMAWA